MPKGKSKNKYLSKKGVYELDHPNKYVGPLTEGGVLYRSSWEARVFYYMDHNSKVIEWSSEGLIIPYVFKMDGKVHKYYPDILAKIETSSGVRTFILEIKPEKQTKEPNKPKNRSLDRKKRYESELYTYSKNLDKWEAAKTYCEKHEYEFKLITEKDIFN